MKENEEITHNNSPEALSKLLIKVSEIQSLLLEKTKVQGKHPKELFTIVEVCALLKISKSTVNKLRKEGLPVISFQNSIIRYDLDDVIAFIKHKNRGS